MFDIWRRNPSNKSEDSAPAKWHLVRLYSGCFPSRLICHPITDDCTWSREPQMNGRRGGGCKKAHQFGCCVAGICVCAAPPPIRHSGERGTARRYAQRKWVCVRELHTSTNYHRVKGRQVSKEVDSAQLHTMTLMSRDFHHLITQQLENSRTPPLKRLILGCSA